jgi:hypothetical protein
MLRTTGLPALLWLLPVICYELSRIESVVA